MAPAIRQHHALEQSNLEPFQPVNFWDDGGGFFARLAQQSTLPGTPQRVVYQDQCSSNVLDTASYKSPQMTSSTAAPSIRPPQSVSARSSSAPSLCRTEIASVSSGSISTTQGHKLGGGRLLEDVGDGLLELRREHVPHPIYQCDFGFLGCSEAFHEKEAWKTHSLAHFRGQSPPRTIVCPLCDHFPSTYCFTDGVIAWNARLEHLAAEHFHMGEDLRTTRPDFALFNHLWRKKVIDNAVLKELKAHHTISESQHFSGTYSVTEAPAGARRDARTRPATRLRN